jgi:hypothetical protein
MLDQAFDALKTFDWGTELSVVGPIDEAVVKTHGDDSARRELESRLAAVLATDCPRDAKDYVCRKLMLVGSAASVAALSALLAQEENSHMARYALERIEAPEAGAALRAALGQLNGVLKIGVISSIGDRGDAESVADLAALLGDSDAQVARAAALALGAIRSPEAAKALAKAKPADAVKPAVTDASLACAEALLASGKKGEALMIYKSYAGENQPKQVRLAATRGMLACAGK